MSELKATIKGLVSRGVKAAGIADGHLWLTWTDDHRQDLGQVVPVDGLHAASHASGGADAVSPASIGAAAVSHAASHAGGGADAVSPASIGAAAVSHAASHASGGADAVSPASIGAAAVSHAASHASGGSDAVTPAGIGAAVKALYTATIPTAWAGSSAPYTQAVTVNGILADDEPHITPVYSADTATAMGEREAWGCVCKATATADAISFTCFEDKPTAAIPIQIEVIR